MAQRKLSGLGGVNWIASRHTQKMEERVRQWQWLANEPKMVHHKSVLPKLSAAFYSQPGSDPPSQPVREWLKRLPREERLEIGSDIQSVQFGWPLGMPLVKHLRGDLFEVRSTLKNRIARLIFAVHGNTMYLLHGFIKASQKTSPAESALAEKRWNQIKS